MQEAIHSARQMDEQSKAAGFYQEALDFIARQGFANAQFEIHGEEGMEIVEEYYPEAEQAKGEQQYEAEGFVQNIQQGLQQSVRAVN